MAAVLYSLYIFMLALINDVQFKKIISVLKCSQLFSNLKSLYKEVRG